MNLFQLLKKGAEDEWLTNGNANSATVTDFVATMFNGLPFIPLGNVIRNEYFSYVLTELSQYSLVLPSDSVQPFIFTFEVITST